MIDQSQLPVQQTKVMVWVLYGNDDDYTYLGTGNIEVVTDADKYRFQHYVEVTNPDNNLLFLRSRLQEFNNYERHKSTVITWSDPEQEVKNTIGISFEDEETCDMYWRILCSKVGKNYLEINGPEKLFMPNEKNLRILLEKMKSSYNLVAYHVLNSKQFMTAFWSNLQKSYSTKSAVKGITVIRQLLFRFDPKIMEIFLSDPNFINFLKIYELETKIDFQACYQKTTGTQEIVKLTRVARKRIQLALRSKFVNQCVLDQAKDASIQSMLNKMVKENQMEALIDMLKDKCIEKIVDLYNSTKDQNEITRLETVRKIVNFLLESAWILRIHHADLTKSLFVTTFYKSGMFKIMAQLLQQGFHKALQVINCVAVLDQTRFFREFSQDYRTDSGNSIARIIGKQYSQTKDQSLADETIDFLKNLAPIMLANKNDFQLFNKTMIYSIFASCKNLDRILPLIITCISDLKALRPVIEHMVNFKCFDIIRQQMEKKTMPKNDILLVSKIVKLVMEEDKEGNENIEAVKMAYKYLASSRIFYLLLVYLRENINHNNMVTSSIIGIIHQLAKRQFNLLTKQMQCFKFEDMDDKNYVQLQKPIQAINAKKEAKAFTNGDIDSLNEGATGEKRAHREMIDEEQEENYLQQEQEQEKMDIMITEQEKQSTKGIESQKQFKQIMQIKLETPSEEDQQEALRREMKERCQKIKERKRKKKEQELIEFHFYYDESLDQV